MSESLADDLLTGANAIAAYLGWNRRSVYNVVEKCHGWPIWVEGGVYYASREILRKHIAKRAEEAMNRTRAPKPAPPPDPPKGKKNGNRPSHQLAA